jgi:dTDP-4-dehydrorhamnose 3,5-epimerase
MSSIVVEETAIPAVKVVTARKFGDFRGYFSEVYNRRDFAAAGLDLDFVQDNQSLSALVGTIRGLHFQAPPFAQDKLVRVTRGAILDLAVDIRRSSPTYGRHVAVELSAENWRQLLIPAGFLHGFCTLAPDTEVIYKVTHYYSPEHDLGVAWNDPDIAIAWPTQARDAILSARDAMLPGLRDLPPYFD